MHTETEVYFNKVTATLPIADRHIWERDVVAAEADRLVRADAMDILGANMAEPGISNEARPRQGATDGERWIELGLKMEQLQCVCQLVQQLILTICQTPRSSSQPTSSSTVVRNGPETAGAPAHPAVSTTSNLTIIPISGGVIFNCSEVRQLPSDGRRIRKHR